MFNYLRKVPLFNNLVGLCVLDPQMSAELFITQADCSETSPISFCLVIVYVAKASFEYCRSERRVTSKKNSTEQYIMVNLNFLCCGSVECFLSCDIESQSYECFAELKVQSIKSTRRLQFTSYGYSDGRKSEQTKNKRKKVCYATKAGISKVAWSFFCLLGTRPKKFRAKSRAY